MIQETTQQPTVSVIIPTYNNASLIGRTINSVLAQTFTDYELLIIDDGSTDSTDSLIESIAKTHPSVRYFYKPNGGVSSARNFGIDQAQGQYISFLDSDDLWDDRFLEKMVAQITEEKKLICFCGYITQRPNEIVKIPQIFLSSNFLTNYIAAEKYGISTDSWLIERNFILNSKVTFTHGSSICEDQEFFSKLLFLAGDTNITCVKDYLTTYIQRGSSLSGYDEIAPTMEKVIEHLETYGRRHRWFIEHKATPDQLRASSAKIKDTYLYYLWNLLLLSDFHDYLSLRKNYRRNKQAFALNKVSEKNIVYQFFNVIFSSILLSRLAKLLFSKRYHKKKKHKKNSLSSSQSFE